jgi:type VI secretion system protein ImpF
MARSDSETRITLSVLDRLTDSEPGRPVDPPPSRMRSLRELKQAVRRDLEWLLNSRRSILPLSPDLEQTIKSLATYGLPDFSAASVSNPSDRASILKTLERTIAQFERRLKSVAIAIETGATGKHSLRFRIDAELDVDPAPEQVAFDTTLQLYNGEYDVKEEE